jgi:hypothetical protein
MPAHSDLGSVNKMHIQNKKNIRIDLNAVN